MYRLLLWGNRPLKNRIGGSGCAVRVKRCTKNATKANKRGCCDSISLTLWQTLFAGRREDRSRYSYTLLSHHTIHASNWAFKNVPRANSSEVVTLVSREAHKLRCETRHTSVGENERHVRFMAFLEPTSNTTTNNQSCCVDAKVHLKTTEIQGMVYATCFDINILEYVRHPLFQSGLHHTPKTRNNKPSGR